jgi:hypothetical protein
VIRYAALQLKKNERGEEEQNRWGVERSQTVLSRWKWSIELFESEREKYYERNFNCLGIGFSLLEDLNT